MFTLLFIGFIFYLIIKLLFAIGIGVAQLLGALVLIVLFATILEKLIK